MLSKEDKERIGELIQKYQIESGPLISILQETQDVFGYLPQDILSYLSQKLKISESKIWGIVTFYGQFYLAPRGKNIISHSLQEQFDRLFFLEASQVLYQHPSLFS